MMLGALLDLGSGPSEAIHKALDAVAELGFLLMESDVERNGIQARSVRVALTTETDQPDRSYAEIRNLIEKGGLEEGVKTRAIEMFEALAAAEGKVHGTTPEKVHFHEVGAVDSIVDIIGVAAGLEHLDADIHACKVPVGHGFVKARHGVLPVPAPATLHLLEGIPIEGTEIADELVTPTGATILKTQVHHFGHLPPMRPLSTGWGAGTRDHDDRPGLLRVVLGEPVVESKNAVCVAIEANIDDMTGEVAAHAIGQVMDAGALDAWVTPITMKKGRPAMQLGALVAKADLERLTRVILNETTTIGLRFHEVGRVEMPRRTVTVITVYGPIPVKLSGGDDGPRNVAPEFDSCRKAARRKGVPVKHVLAAAAAAALKQL